MKKRNLVISILGLAIILSACEKAPVELKETPPIETPIEEPIETPSEDPVPLPVVEPESPIEPVIEPEPVIKDIPEVIFSPESQSLWTTTPLNLRKGPNSDYDIILEIPQGAQVSTIAKGDNGWYQVLYKGVEGYSSGKYLAEEEIKPEVSGFVPYRLYINDKILTYENGGMEKAQEIIDTYRSVVSTWGEVADWSPNDSKNTYFIGHSDAAFEGIWDTPMNSEIIITDEFGNPVTYVLSEIYIVDDYAVGLDDGVNYFDYLTSAGTEEVITLQTCKTDDTNYILRAKLKI